MRALTPKEKKLLAVLVAVLFVVLNVVGLQAFLNRQRALQKTIARLESDVTLHRAVLAEKAEWTARAAWLDANQPVDDITTTEDDSKFNEFIGTSARRCGLEYTRRESGARPVDGVYTEVFDVAQVKGKMEALVKWLHELQQPKAFRAIKQISIKSGEPPEVICEIEVARWFKPSGEVTP